jgi:hypothetical protein
MLTGKGAIDEQFFNCSRMAFPWRRLDPRSNNSPFRSPPGVLSCRSQSLKALIETRNTRLARVFLVGAEFKSRAGQASSLSKNGDRQDACSTDPRDSLAELGELAQTAGAIEQRDGFLLAKNKTFDAVIRLDALVSLRGDDADFRVADFADHFFCVVVARAERDDELVHNRQYRADGRDKRIAELLAVAKKSEPADLHRRSFRVRISSFKRYPVFGRQLKKGLKGCLCGLEGKMLLQVFDPVF